MNISLSDVSCKLDNTECEKKIVWLETAFYNIPWNILDVEQTTNVSYNCGRLKPKYIDASFKFVVQRFSELHFRITFFRIPSEHLVVPGNYMFQFVCDSNVFGEDTKVVNMQSNHFETLEDFWLSASYREDFSSNDLKKQIELKILIQLIEFDCVYPSDIGYQTEELRKTLGIFNNESVLNDLFNILQIRRLEDSFAGRQNGAFFTKKRFYICKIAIFAEEILSYLKSKSQPTTEKVNHSKDFFKHFFKGKVGELTDKDILLEYIEAHHIGLIFLINLSRDCLLYRLSEHKTKSPEDYDYFLFDLLKAAAHVNDIYLFEGCAEKFYDPEKNFVIGDFLKKLKVSIHTRFALRTLERRRKMIEKQHRIGAGAEETSKFFECL